MKPLSQKIVTVLLALSFASSILGGEADGPASPFGAELPPALPYLQGAAGAQTSPAIVPNGTDFLMVWSDGRMDAADERRETDIWGARIDEVGTLLDPTGFPISSMKGIAETVPAVAWNGNSYFVAWLATDPIQSNTTIRLVRFGLDLAPIFPGPVSLLTPIQGFPNLPLLQSNGRGATLLLRVAVTIERDFDEATVFSAHMLDQNGTEFATPLSLSRNESSGFPAFASNSQEFLVVRFQGSQLVGSRISEFGSLIETKTLASLASGDTPGRPAIAWNGSEYLVTVGTDKGKMLMQRLSATAAPIGTPITVVSDFSRIAINPVVAPSGEGWTIAAAVENGRLCPFPFCAGIYDLHTLLITRDGTVLRDRVQSQPFGVGGKSAAIIAAASHVILVAWDDDVDVRGNLLAPDLSDVPGSVFQGRILSLSARADSPPSIATDGKNFLVITQDSDTALPIGSLLNSRGEILRQDLFFPGVRAASNGKGFLVAYEEDDRILARFVTSSGSTASGTPREIAEGIAASSIEVVSDGVDYLVTWAGTQGVYSKRISLAGAVDVVETVISRDPASKAGLRAVWNGAQYLVVWSEDGPNCNARGCGANLRAARLSRSNLLLGFGPLFISRENGDQTSPSVSWSGSNYLVVWTSPNTDEADIRGTRLSFEGNLLDGGAETDGVQIGTNFGIQRAPTVAFNGTRFVVVWQKTIGSGDSDLVGQSFDPAVSLTSTPGEFIVSQAPDDEGDAALVRGFGDQLALAYRRRAGEKEYGGVKRAFVRLTPSRVPLSSRQRVTRRS